MSEMKELTEILNWSSKVLDRINKADLDLVELQFKYKAMEETLLKEIEQLKAECKDLKEWKILHQEFSGK